MLTAVEPFDTLREQLPGWVLAVTTLEGLMGFIDRDNRTIWTEVTLPFAQWRSTAMHEVVHAIRGDDHDDETDEQAAQAATARALIPIDALAAAFTISINIDDVLDQLCVDVGTLRTRIRDLHPDEASQLRRALSAQMRLVGTEPGGCAISRWWRHQQQPHPVPRLCGHPDLVRFGPVRLPSLTNPAISTCPS